MAYDFGFLRWSSYEIWRHNKIIAWTYVSCAILVYSSVLLLQRLQFLDHNYRRAGPVQLAKSVPEPAASHSIKPFIPCRGRELLCLCVTCYLHGFTPPSRRHTISEARNNWLYSWTYSLHFTMGRASRKVLIIVSLWVVLARGEGSINPVVVQGTCPKLQYKRVAGHAIN